MDIPATANTIHPDNIVDTDARIRTKICRSAPLELVKHVESYCNLKRKKHNLDKNHTTGNLAMRIHVRRGPSVITK